MKAAARIQAVIDLLTEVENTPRPADTLASLYFRGRRYIGSSDRAGINSRYYGTMREYHRLSWWIKKSGLPVTPRNLMITTLILSKEHNDKSIEEMFSGEKFAPLPLNADEKKLVQDVLGNDLEHPDMPVKDKSECPDWAYNELAAALGDGFEAELSAMLTQAPLDIRVNTIKANRDEVLQALKSDGFEAELGKHSPTSIRLFNRPSITQHPLYANGLIEIQDEGSQMIAVVADPQPGWQVADFCAGAGGKTLAMGARMDNKGRIVAMDVLDGRLKRAKQRFRRAGLHNIETRPLTSENDRYVKRHVGGFDLVLVDAPCSGTGTWRRDPDKRFRQLGPGLSSLVPLQESILQSASRMVKAGGRLVYATCSLLPEENENQIEKFLSVNKDFKRQPLKNELPDMTSGDYLKMTPAQHDTDGFFAAVLLRDKDALKDHKKNRSRDTVEDKPEEPNDG